MKVNIKSKANSKNGLKKTVPKDISVSLFGNTYDIFKPGTCLVSWNCFYPEGCVCIRACVCISLPPGYEKLFTWNEAWITNQASPTAYQFAYKALTINIIDGHGLINEACH